MPKEARARIKINHLLETAGWRFFDSSQGTANIALESNAKLTQAQVDAVGNDFESSSLKQRQVVPVHGQNQVKRGVVDVLNLPCAKG